MNTLSPAQQSALAAIKELDGRVFYEVSANGRTVSRSTLKVLRRLGYIKHVDIATVYYYVGSDRRSRKEIGYVAA